MSSKLVFLSFAPNRATSNGQPIERDVDRMALVDIAPDREDVFLSDISTEDLRLNVKIRSLSTQAIWLNQYIREQDTKLPKGNVRTSVLLGTHNNNENVPANQTAKLTTRRRVLSESTSHGTEGNAMGSIANRLVSDRDGNVFDIWGTGPLSTTDRLISPRPLGPTHLLTIVSQEELSGKKGVFTQAVQVPINDLLFTLNAPNLQTVLPKRLFKELPRVAVKVPHIESFRAVIVFMHTLNQAELIRAVIPEWMRDIMHVFAVSKTAQLLEIPVLEKRKPKLLGMLSLASTSSASLDSYQQAAQTTESEQQLGTIAKEIAEAAQEMELDVVVETATMLNGLRDNLQFIGYFGKPLWAELNFVLDVLIRVVTLTSRIDNPCD